MYYYKDPRDHGFDVVHLKPKDHNELFPHRRKTWRNNFEYFIKDDEFLMHEFTSGLVILIEIVLFPLVLLLEGLLNFKSVIKHYKRLLNQKKYGAFISESLYQQTNSFNDVKTKIIY